MIEAGVDPHVLRDPTRGGVTSALTEIAQTAKVGILLDEASVPISEEVKGACEILGLDPLYVANEGKLIAIVADKDADIAIFSAHPFAPAARVEMTLVDGRKFFDRSKAPTLEAMIKAMKKGVPAT